MKEAETETEATPRAHVSVLERQAVEALGVTAGSCYIDATFGRGGHSRAILKALSAASRDRMPAGAAESREQACSTAGRDRTVGGVAESQEHAGSAASRDRTPAGAAESREHAGLVLALDRDPQAIHWAAALAREDGRLRYAQATFGRLAAEAERAGISGQVSGVLLDLGVSSPQLDDPARGFSFMRDGPLDMRMNPDRGRTAAEWLNEASERDIATVLYRYGEERHSRRMARHIVAQRRQEPILTTGRLASLCQAAQPRSDGKRHPATRAFQAIRIFINDELAELRAGLGQALAVLAPGGRLVVISFHSLEHRIVKGFIAEQARGDRFPRQLPVTADQLRPTLRAVGKARRPTAAEVAANPRARSAVMHVAEKCAEVAP